MQAFVIPRIESGSEGIEVLWTWPAVLPISIDGYDVWRLDQREFRLTSVCETIHAAQISGLRSTAEMSAPLGPLRLTTGGTFRNIDSAQQSMLAGAPVHGGAIASAATASVGVAHIDLFIQELNQPADRVTVTPTASFSFIVAQSSGKAVAWGQSSGAPSTIVLTAAKIDTIRIYTIGIREFSICAFYPAQPHDEPWAKAKLIAKGLTLPIHECDLALTSPAGEFATAVNRLVGAETLDPTRFARMCDTLRAPAAGSSLGRSGARVSLNRGAADQNFEELSLEQQLSALTLHPKLRRVLGLGHHDKAGLVPGHAYAYRVVGRFKSADVEDEIYDVHRLPASATLPDSFWIRDVGFRCQTPVKVVLDPEPNQHALHATSRRGIHIDTSSIDETWLLPFYEEWSTIITLPYPVLSLVLEVAAGHSFVYAAGLPWSFGSPAPAALPPGPWVELTFPTPIQELRFAGKGIFFALRLPKGDKKTIEIHADTPVVLFAGKPLPIPPLALVAANLQQPPAPIVGPIDEKTPVPPRQPVGLRLTWLPAALNNVPVWPDDIESGPPLDALAYVIDHRKVVPSSSFGPWEAINADDNLTFGSRDMTAPIVRLEHGCDLDLLFPANRPREMAGLTLSYSDVFGEKDPTTGTKRPAQPLGSYHQYRIRSMDAAGRISGAETLSNVIRLEKHQPPPLPVGKQPAPALEAGHLAGPPGAHARAIVRGAPGLSAADVATLGAHQNAIVLEWGWRQSERDLDPFTTEFRVYSTQPADTVNANITSVVSLGFQWRLSLTTSLPLVAGELVGQWLTIGGTAYLIAQNDAGLTPQIVVERSKVNPAAQPVVGNVVFGRPLRPEHQNPGAWDHRVAVYPLTAADSYRHVFFDALTLNVNHPRNAIWVGVSAADGQTYVNDQRTLGAFANRPGNESAIAVSVVVERYRGQPVFSVPPPLGEVPELVTEEPTGRQVLVKLDLPALLGAVLPANAPVLLERCGADEILSRTRVSGGNVVLTHKDGSTQIIAFPNPADDAEVLSVLNGENPQRLANRYLMHLLVAATDPAAYFERQNADILTFGPVNDRLAPKSGRFFYFLRSADALGHISDGGALLPVVVRVPSVAGAATPIRRALAGEAGLLSLTVAVLNDLDTTHLLLFVQQTPAGALPKAQGEAEILRVPNRRDLYPANGIRLRLDDGGLLSPQVVKSLADADVTHEADGTRVAILHQGAAGGSWLNVWCVAVTRDGQTSNICGPFGQGVLT
jgi:hypothetical protein